MFNYFWYGDPVGQPFDAAEASPSSSDSRPVTRTLKKDLVSKPRAERLSKPCSAAACALDSCAIIIGLDAPCDTLPLRTM